MVGNQNQETKMDEIYDKLDENENGKISREEFKFALQQLELTVSDELLTRIISIVSNSTKKWF